VRSVDAALAASLCVDTMRAGTWALGGRLDMVRKALMNVGAGFWVFGGGVGAEQVAVALGEAADIVRDMLFVIFITTVAAKAKARGANGDCGRRQLALDAGCLARLGLVPGLRAGLAAMDGMFSVLAHFFSARYFSYFPVLLFSEPGAAQQLAHTDAAPVSLVGAGAPRLPGGLLAVPRQGRDGGAWAGGTASGRGARRLRLRGGTRGGGDATAAVAAASTAAAAATATAGASSEAATTAAAAAAAAAANSATADPADTSSAAASPADDVTACGRWAGSQPVRPPGV